MKDTLVQPKLTLELLPATATFAVLTERELTAVVGGGSRLNPDPYDS